MSTIDKRKYEYHDDGILPETGDYGITYLTIFSSGAGNVYDGWVWDPDRKNHSEIERTFGYRNPDYPDYCWDDEVVVDLSNAQNRQESSEFEQGRITSFNTNVSDQPIILQDIDPTGLTEAQREAKATTVLFSAIPLIKDAYIHAEVEVAMKMNLSSSNTTGRMRLEAFYILNDSSDRTMRPHPINHYSVATENEWNLLRLLYWNPALRHEDMNYIGVKLLCSGGTAEIGISDNPEYGDAIITLTSAGLVGDHIDEKRTPVSLDIFGREEVFIGYEIDVDDYTVLCEYDDGSIFEVTRLCNFTPEIGSEIELPITTLTANYEGLSASMELIAASVDHIEVTGLDYFAGESLLLDANNYKVYAYYTDDRVVEVTDECYFSPQMGSYIWGTTTLNAYYTPSFMPGRTFAGSLVISKVSVVSQQGTDIIYTLYDNGLGVISGSVNDSWHITNEEFYNADPNYPGDMVYRATVVGRGNHDSSDKTLTWTPGSNSVTGNPNYYFDVRIPEIFQNATKIRYELTGKPLGLTSCHASNTTTNGYPWNAEAIGFENMDTSKIASMRNAFRISNNDYNTHGRNSIDLSFLNGKEFPNLKDLYGTFEYNELNGLENLDVSNVVNFNRTFHVALFNNADLFENIDTSNAVYCYRTFGGIEGFTNLDFMSNFNFSNVVDAEYMFGGCQVSDIDGIRSLDTSSLTNCRGMFTGNRVITSIHNTIGQWDSSSITDSREMFASCIELVNLGANNDFFLNMANGALINGMFKDCTALTSVSGVSIGLNIGNVAQLFYGCTSLTDLAGAELWQMGNKGFLSQMFYNCPISAASVQYLASWDVSNVTAFYQFMNDTSNIRIPSREPNAQHTYEYPALEYLNNWNVRRSRGLTMNDQLAFGREYYSSSGYVLPNVVVYNASSHSYKTVPTWYRDSST